MDTYPLELTKIECIYLSDALSMFASGPPGAEHPPYPDLLLRILSAFAETQPGGPPVTVSMSQDDLWTIREVAKSSVMVGTEKVGLNLLAKVASGLLRLSAGPQVRDAIDSFGETEQTEPGKGVYRTQLRTIAERASKGGDTDARNNDSS